MKRAYLLLTSALFLFALSCTKEEFENPVSSGNRVVIKASQELPANMTKSTIQNGIFLWSVGDRIACYSSTGNFEYSEPLESADITGNGELARFYLSLSGSNNPYLHSVAVFPVYPTVNSVSYAPSYDEVGDDLTIKIPETMAWKEGEINNIQIATFSGGSNINLSFYNVAGMIKFTLNNIPVGANQVIFKTGRRITGDFVIEDVSKKSQADTYITAGDASDDGITFTFDEVTTAGTSKVFYVPAPTGTYNSIGFRVQNNDGSTLWKKTATVDNTVKRGVILVMPALTFASATGGGEGDPATIITTLSGQTGTVNLPSTTDNVLVELNSTSGELTLAYSEEENAKKPAVVYVRVLADATVGTLNINLPNSTVYLNGKANSNVTTLTSVTAESTLKVLESPLAIGTATINQGNVEVAGTVNDIVVASGATSDGQTAGENNKILLSVSSAAAVQRITLNAVTDVIVEQPKDNIVAENTENKVYVVVNATGSTAKAQNGGDIYVTANADCKVTADGNEATVVLENNGAKVTTEENNNGVITEGKTAKAKIGSTTYASVAEALAAAQNGQIITLLADNVLTESLVNEKTITIDLGENSISGAVGQGTAAQSEAGWLINNKGNLTITSANNQGRIWNTCIDQQGRDAVYNAEGATITINGGVFGDPDTDTENDNVDINRGGGIRNYGTAILNGGKFTAADNFTTGGGYAYAIINYGEMTINDGVVVYGKNNGNIANNGGNIVINGGSFTANAPKIHYNIYMADGTATINGGTFVKGPLTGSNAIAIYREGGQINITGGTFNKLSTGTALANKATGISITGGTFTVDPTAYLASGYKATDNGNGTWTVGLDYAAQIGTTNYVTLDEALDKVKDGETITLQKNVDHTSANLVVALGTKNVTLDLNGKTLSGRTNLTSGKLTISNGTVQCTGGQPLNVYGSDNSSAQEYSVLTVNNNVTVNGEYGVCLFGKTASTNGYGAIVNIKGTINANQGVYVSGNLGNKSTLDNACNVINITGTINGGELGVAVSGSSTVNVKSGAKITAGTAIPVKRGKLTVSGGTVTANGTWNAAPAADSNGAELTGAAVSVTSTYNYSGVIDVSITGGTFTSTNGQAVYKYENPAKPFNNAAISISGGKFSSDPSEYVADNYRVKPGSSPYTVEKYVIKNDVTSRTDIGNSLQNSGYYTLAADLTGRFGTGIMCATDVTINLNGHSIADDTEFGTFLVRGTMKLTLNGEGVVSNSNAGGPAVWTSGTPTVTINGGTYVTEHQETIYCEKGTIYITGGSFRTNNAKKTFLLNCKDANYTAGTAKIIVTGGKFYDFNPADCTAEGAGTSFVADGYKSVQRADEVINNVTCKVWEVVAK